MIFSNISGVLMMLSLIVAIIYSIKAGKDFDSISSGIITFFCTFLFGFLINIVVFMGFSLALTQKENLEYDIINSQNIYALKDTAGKEYYLGQNNDLLYYYMIKDDRGYNIQRVDSENVYLKYVNDTFKVEEYEAYFKYDWMNFLGVPVDKNYYIFYIPENSIEMGYKIDME